MRRRRLGLESPRPSPRRPRRSAACRWFQARSNLCRTTSSTSPRSDRSARRSSTIAGSPPRSACGSSTTTAPGPQTSAIRLLLPRTASDASRGQAARTRWQSAHSWASRNPRTPGASAIIRRGDGRPAFGHLPSLMVRTGGVASKCGGSEGDVAGPIPADIPGAGVPLAARSGDCLSDRSSPTFTVGRGLTAR